MEGIGMLIFFCFALTFFPPVIFLFIGLAKRRNNKDSATVFFILSASWFTIGGGICASIMTG
jgi:hypothetical protein